MILFALIDKISKIGLVWGKIMSCDISVVKTDENITFAGIKFQQTNLMIKKKKTDEVKAVTYTV